MIAMFSIPGFQKYTVVEVRDFSCEAISGFAFQYPVFEKWEVQSIAKTAENECTIFLDWPENIDFEVAPRIIVRKIEEQQPPDFRRVSDGGTNHFKAKYEFVYFPSHYVGGYDPKGRWDAIHFSSEGSDYGVLVIVDAGGEDDGFSGKAFAEKVTGTFRFLER